MTGIISASLTLFSIQVGFPVAGILVGDYFLKSQKDKKVRYALGISAFAFGGWLLSNHITTKYLDNVEITLEAESAKDSRIVSVVSQYQNPDFHYNDLDSRGYIPLERVNSMRTWLIEMEARGYSYIIREDSQQVVYDDEGNSYSSNYPEFMVFDITNEDDMVDLLSDDIAFYSDRERREQPYLFISERNREIYLTHYPLNTKRQSHLVRYYPASSVRDVSFLFEE